MSLSAPTCFGACCSVVSSTPLSSRACSRCKEKAFWVHQSREPVMKASQGMSVRGEWGMLGDFLGMLLSYWEGGIYWKGEESHGAFWHISHKVMLREKKRKQEAYLSIEGVNYWAREGKGAERQKKWRSLEGWVRLGQVVSGLGQLLEKDSGLLEGLTTQCWFLCSQTRPWCWSPFVNNWFLSLHLQKQKSSTRRES